MPEYLRYNDKGEIIKKYYSVDPSVVKGLSNIVEIPRDVFKSITKFHKVVDGKVVEMTDEEKDLLIAKEQQAEREREIASVENLEITVRDLAKALVMLGIVDKDKLKNAILQIRGLK